MTAPSWSLYKHVLDTIFEPRLTEQRRATEHQLHRETSYEVWFTDMTEFSKRWEDRPYRMMYALLTLIQRMEDDREWRNSIMGVPDHHPWWVFTRQMFLRWRGKDTNKKGEPMMVVYFPNLFHDRCNFLQPSRMDIPHFIQHLIDYWILYPTPTSSCVRNNERSLNGTSSVSSV